MLTDLSQLKFIGEHVKIYEMAKLAVPSMIEIGLGTQIDDFVFINGGSGVQIGQYNHIASFVSVVGGGRFVTGDYVGIAAGARIVTGSHHYGDGKRISPLIPEEEQFVIRGVVVLEKDVFVGTNAIIHPNVTVGEGAIIGSGGLVLHDIEPWTINVGAPTRVIGERPRIRVHE
jgi:acetyltransferase-like isoleucine patch superfamily enzyme